jgi:hypothetical protein
VVDVRWHGSKMERWSERRGTWNSLEYNVFQRISGLVEKYVDKVDSLGAESEWDSDVGDRRWPQITILQITIFAIDVMNFPPNIDADDFELL